MAKLTRPRTAHAGAAEAENYFLPPSSQLINQTLIVRIVANSQRWRNVTLCITHILCPIPGVRYSKSDDYVRVCVKLSGSRAGLPISNVCDETRIFSVVDVVVESGGWSGRRWRGRWRVRAGSILTTRTTIIRRGSTPLRQDRTYNRVKTNELSVERVQHFSIYQLRELTPH